MNTLLDTNVISELIARNPNEQGVQWVDKLEPDTVFLSVLTVGEIRKGIEKVPPSKRRERLSAWLESDLLVRFEGHLVPIDVDTMLAWGQMAAVLERDGTPMGAIDSLLAATALTGEFVLATRNVADFKGTGVTVVNPWD